MTPRQAAAIERRIRKLETQQNRATAPLKKRSLMLGVAWETARRRALKKVDVAFSKKARPIDKRIDAIIKKFNKKIIALNRKLTGYAPRA